ncbi:hypothetical protein [Actinokineospora sp. NBRC 105648]|uniref:hypothetical protein n=1 Tax=Actinokineospora sp. NBRC 105648 TaxID=3032206 RepID=UPI0024A3FE29|nr:hypothetical protein [Actinokineospora sp. NBRC 105648]GLZ37604.1 hypothetical protein Acsp05_12290 [Actinokineospora sp. NBRC 105648]
MDEHKISELFNDAVRDVPPPSFGVPEVSAESARLTRKRNGLLAGSALGFAVLAGAVVTGVALWSGPSESGSGNDSAALAPMSVSESNGDPAPNEVPTDAPRIAEQTDPGSPSSTPKQGGSTTGDAGTSAGGTPGGCGSADRELAAALAGELPSAVSRGDVVASPLSCPTGSRSGAFAVADGPRKGLVSIMVTPKGVAPMQQPPWADRPASEGVVVQAKSGATIVLEVEAVPGSAAPPIDAGVLRDIGSKLAPRY